MKENALDNIVENILIVDKCEMLQKMMKSDYILSYPIDNVI